jgi:hypothetical protein
MFNELTDVACNGDPLTGSDRVGPIKYTAHGPEPSDRCHESSTSARRSILSHRSARAAERPLHRLGPSPTAERPSKRDASPQAGGGLEGGLQATVVTVNADAAFVTPPFVQSVDNPSGPFGPASRRAARCVIDAHLVEGVRNTGAVERGGLLASGFTKIRHPRRGSRDV